MTNADSLIRSAKAVTVLSLFLWSGTAHALENWQPQSQSPMGVSEGNASNFYGQVFVSGYNGSGGETSRSSDGVTWVPTATNARFFENFVVLNGALYGFESPPVSFVPEVVWETTDGTNWISLGPGPASQWDSGPVSFGGSIYRNGAPNLWRSSGSGSSLSWQSVGSVPSDLAASSFGKVLFVYNNKLLFGGFTDAQDFKLYETSDGLTWNVLGAFSDAGGFHGLSSQQATNEFYNVRIASSTAGLYIGLGSLWFLPSGSSTWSMLYDPGPYSLAVPIAMFGLVHVYQMGFASPLSVPILSLLSPSRSGQWPVEAIFPTYLLPPYFLSLGGTELAFVGSPEVSTLSAGVTAISGETFVESSLSFGQTGAVALSWSQSVNISDVLTGLTVTNKGTAVAGSDIADIKLELVSNLPIAGNVETIATLVPSANGKSWTAPSNFNFRIQDGDVMDLIVDISSSPTNGATCLLSLQSVQCQQNSAFQLSAPITAPDAQTIQGRPVPVQVPLTDVLIAPFPAHDKVNFVYDLDAPAHVEIRLFDRVGRQIHEIEDDKPAGMRGMSTWDASSAATGLYFAVIRIAPEGEAERHYKKKIILER